MMRRFRPFLVLGLAVVLALITSGTVYHWLRQQAGMKPEAGPASVPTEPVAMAKTDLPVGTKLSEEMVELVPFPRGRAPDGHLTSLEQAKGRVLLTALKRHEPILQARLAPPGVTTGGMAALMGVDKRAMAVKVDEVAGVAGFVKPGDRVDVLVTINPSQKLAQKLAPVVTKVVLQNALVLAAGSDLERKGQDQEPMPVKVVALEVTPSEAEKLALAATEGKLRLALRNPLNAEPVLTNGATIPSLLASYRRLARTQAKTKPILETEVIKGATVSRVRFRDSVE